MKNIVLFIMIAILVVPVMANDTEYALELADFDRSLEGFGFSKGELIKVDPDGETLPMEVDFIFDMPNGLGMNNFELTSWFPGNAGIIDLGEIALDTETESPSDGFVPFLEPDKIIPGHTYFIRTADGKHFGKIYIVMFDQDREILYFTWDYTEE